MIYVARDKTGNICCYVEEPKKQKEYGFFYSNSEYIMLDKNEYPEVTWENSPKELKIKD